MEWILVVQSKEYRMKGSQSHEDIGSIVTSDNIIVVVNWRELSSLYILRLQELTLTEQKLITIGTSIDLKKE